MDHETKEVINQLSYFNPNVTNEYELRSLLPNAVVYLYGNKLKITGIGGGMLIIDIRDIVGDIAPFSD